MKQNEFPPGWDSELDQGRYSGMSEFRGYSGAAYGGCSTMTMLLFDQNLSPHLVDQLADLYLNSGHVHTLGLEISLDRVVWEYARQHDYTIVTKDADFSELSLLFRPEMILGWETGQEDHWQAILWRQLVKPEEKVIVQHPPHPVRAGSEPALTSATRGEGTHRR